MKTSELILEIPTLLEDKIVPLIYGPPGIGKTQISESIASDMGLEVLILIPSMMMPTDLMGLPFRKSQDAADFLPYGFALQILNATKPLLVILDDMIIAPPLMQAALMQMVELRSIGGKKIPDCVSFVILSNGANHGAGGGKVLEPLKGRTIILEMEVDSKQWVKWGMESNRIVSDVLFYIRCNGASLSNFALSKDMVNTPSPRNWERLSKIRKRGKDNVELFAGCVGQAEGSKFHAFLRSINDLKGMIPEIVSNPMSARMFNERSELDKVYSLGIALGNFAERDNFDTIGKYVSRYNGEISEFILTHATSIKPYLKETSTYTTYLTNGQN